MESIFVMLITSSLVQFSGVVSAPLSNLEAMSTGVFISPLGKAVLIQQADGGMGSKGKGKKANFSLQYFSPLRLCFYL